MYASVGTLSGGVYTEVVLCTGSVLLIMRHQLSLRSRSIPNLFALSASMCLSSDRRTIRVADSIPVGESVQVSILAEPFVVFHVRDGEYYAIQVIEIFSALI